MQRFATNGIPYNIPADGVYIEKRPWKSEKNKSKYFDLQKDTQAGPCLGSMDDMRKEYLEQVCGGIPW